MRMRTLIATGAGLAMVAGCSSGGGEREPTPEASATTIPAVEISAPDLSEVQTGFSIGDSLLESSPEEVEVAFDLMEDLGTDSVRLEYNWFRMQPNSADEPIDWSEVEPIEEAAHARDIGIVALVAYTPEWAAAPECAGDFACRPDDPEDFGRFVHAVTEHLAEAGEPIILEVGNEPNTERFFKPAPNPAQYLELYDVARENAHAVAPNALVVTGGLAPAVTDGANVGPGDFYEGLYTAGLEDPEGAAGHGYGFPSTIDQHEPWTGQEQLTGEGPDVHSVQEVLEAHGDGDIPKLDTEIGAPTCGTGIEATPESQQMDRFTEQSYVSPELQSEILRQALTNVPEGVTHVMIFNLYDAAPQGATDRELCFGVYYLPAPGETPRPKDPAFVAELQAAA